MQEAVRIPARVDRRKWEEEAADVMEGAAVAKQTDSVVVVVEEEEEVENALGASWKQEGAEAEAEEAEEAKEVEAESGKAEFASEFATRAPMAVVLEAVAHLHAARP
jgi:hypothetical protein